VRQTGKKMNQLNLQQEPFCTCRINNSSQINIPCGHTIFCKQCAPVLTQKSCCTKCNEAIKRYVSLDITKHVKVTGDVVYNNKYQLFAQLCDPYINDQPVNVCVSVQTENINSHSPCNLCCVVDTSSSMSYPAMFEDVDGVVKKDGSGSVLDVVRRAVKTVIDCLTDRDTFSLVTFSDYGTIKLASTLMTADGKLVAKQKADEMKADGGTIMYSGIAKGFEALKNITGRKSILFMTDGEPTDGYACVTMFDECKKSQRSSVPRVHTFGFGSNLKPGLLPKLAKIGNGINAFIPDSGLTGSTFVRLVGNICSEEAINPKLKLTVLNEAKFDGEIQNYIGDTTNDGPEIRIVNLNGLPFGQTRDVVVPIILPSKKFSVNDKGDQFRCTYLRAELFFEEGKQLSLDCKTLQTSPEAKLADLRSEMVFKLNYAVNADLPNPAIIQELITKMKACQNCHAHVSLILKDLEGRISKGFILEKFKTWGRHYAAAFARAHELQLCTNGLDPSLSIYANILVQAYLMYGKNKYSSEENKTPTHVSVVTGKQIAATTSSFNTYVPPAATTTGTGWACSGGGGGGCFGEFCTVETENMKKYIRDVVPGDKLKVRNGFATVKYVAEILSKNELLQFDNGLQITPGHPIRVNNTWIKARDLNENVIGVQADKIYNLVLDQNHVLLVNNVECVTWGHDSTDHQISHPFYGSSRRISEELNKLSEHGIVRISGFIRDENNHVCGFF